ncbi:hypothetical protein ABIE67_006038 [Streptomyces sp. V4I8]
MEQCTIRMHEPAPHPPARDETDFSHQALSIFDVGRNGSSRSDAEPLDYDRWMYTFRYGAVRISNSLTE